MNKLILTSTSLLLILMVFKLNDFKNKPENQIVLESASFKTKATAPKEFNEINNKNVSSYDDKIQSFQVLTTATDLDSDMDQDSLQEKQEMLSLINQKIESIKYDNYSIRKKWLSQWPDPANQFEELVLLSLSTEVIPSDRKDFDEHIQETGELLTVFPEHKVNNFLINLNNIAADKDNLLMRALVQKYNSKFTMDTRLNDELNRDLKFINKTKQAPDPLTLKSYFDALVNSHDMDHGQKYIHGINVIYRAPAEYGRAMLDIFERKIDPFVKSK